MGAQRGLSTSGRLLLGGLLTLAAIGCAGALAARLPAPVVDRKALAQTQVLAALGRNWNPRHIRGLVDPRTSLPRDNTQVRCHLPRHLNRPAAPGELVCVAAHGDAAGRAKLWVSFRPLRRGRVRVHWLSYRQWGRVLACAPSACRAAHGAPVR